MIGSAAFAGVMTRTTSMALLITEITGQTHLTLGILLASVCSYGIANAFTMSAFNTALSISKMPYLPFMFHSNMYKQRVGKYCDEVDTFLTERMSLFDCLRIFTNKDPLLLNEFIPVVDNKTDKNIIGSVRTLNMLDYMNHIVDNLKDQIQNLQSLKKLDKFYLEGDILWQDSDEEEDQEMGLGGDEENIVRLEFN